MIVNARRLLGLTRKEVEDIATLCHKNEEMFMVIYEKSDLRSGYDFNGSYDCFKFNDNSTICIADMVAYRDENGDYQEVKTRFARKSTSKLITTVVEC